MSRLDIALQNDVKLLALVRDELSLQSQLFKAETRDRWQQLEAQWNELSAHVARAEVAGAEALREAEAAGQLLVETLRKGYRDVRAAMTG